MSFFLSLICLGSQFLFQQVPPVFINTTDTSDMMMCPRCRKAQPPGPKKLPTPNNFDAKDEGAK